MVLLAVLDVDLAVEFQLDMVGRLLGVGVAGEGQGVGLEVEFEGLVGDVGGGDCEVNVITFRVTGGGALGPDN